MNWTLLSGAYQGGGFGGLAPPVTKEGPKKEEKGKERERNREEKRIKEKRKKICMTNRAPFKHKQWHPGGEESFRGAKLTAVGVVRAPKLMTPPPSKISWICP